MRKKENIWSIVFGILSVALISASVCLWTIEVGAACAGHSPCSSGCSKNWLRQCVGGCGQAQENCKTCSCAVDPNDSAFCKCQ